MKRPPLTTDARITEMRKWIANADATGATRAEMLLQLSQRDIAGLKRSPAVAVHEITFVDGLMRFLDIEVVPSTSESRLTMRTDA